VEATIIYNPHSRNTPQADPEDLTLALAEAGYEPRFIITPTATDLDRTLVEVQGLVIVAGGDGSIREAAIRLLDKNNPMAILPLGTANNISNALGIGGSHLEILRGLKEPRKLKFDVGMIRAPWGEDIFLEAAGYGLFATALADYDPAKGKSILRGIDSVIKTLRNYQALYNRIVLDGQDISGEYLLVEAFNTPSVGPRIKLAPKADPHDGLLDVLCIRKEAREQLIKSLMSMLTDELEELPSVEIFHGRELNFSWTGYPFHVDGEVRPENNGWETSERLPDGENRVHLDEEKGRICLGINPRALEIWIPQSPS
jgi:diacylglycerol kinase (ATP)